MLDTRRTDVSYFTLGTTLILRKLSDDTQRMSQLRLATPELSVDLVDALGLEAAIEDRVPLFTTAGDAEAILADMKKFCSCLEATTGRLSKLCQRHGEDTG